MLCSVGMTAYSYTLVWTLLVGIPDRSFSWFSKLLTSLGLNYSAASSTKLLSRRAPMVHEKLITTIGVNYILSCSAKNTGRVPAWHKWYSFSPFYFSNSFSVSTSNELSSRALLFYYSFKFKYFYLSASDKFWAH